MTSQPWRTAIQHALYGPDGFYRTGAGPSAHFRTSVQSPTFIKALAELAGRVDSNLGSPTRFDIVDVGAGRGEFLASLQQQLRLLQPELANRVTLTGVEIAPRPDGLPAEIKWVSEIPQCTGMLIANEWLDNVPVDVVEQADGQPHHVLVDEHGVETLGEPLSISQRPAAASPSTLPTHKSTQLEEVNSLTDSEQTLTKEGHPETENNASAWLAQWWPLPNNGDRAEIGTTRDVAWANAIKQLHAGAAVAIDYGHAASNRPAAGTLMGYRAGRACPPVPDGTHDITAHVAIDAVAAAGRRAGAETTTLTSQREALHALGITATRPPIALATTNPAAYLAQLSAASDVGELTDRASLGSFYWLIQTANCPPPIAVQ